ncbi:hypothetical protein MtrunA17_Chr1g0149311 [Medicago truncatula]|uniref:Uncharacterized protein n=1 Tax=Medicago truncatula TaxID=3880 RepID=A0A396JPH7_MEDTR|nr:hypothetical protein MtrunA17_Chr1g0149311 [Medicago truncatula]
MKIHYFPPYCHQLDIRTLGPGNFVLQFLHSKHKKSFLEMEYARSISQSRL